MSEHTVYMYANAATGYFSFTEINHGLCLCVYHLGMESIDVCILVGGLTPSLPSTLCDCILYWRPALLAGDDKFIIGCRSLSFFYSLSLPFSHILILYLLCSFIFANHSVSFSNSLSFPPILKILTF
jgi:hypothetical protein